VNLAWRGVCLGLAVLAWAPSPSARAHEIRPALLDIDESSPGLFEVTWKLPGRGDRALGLEPILPDNLALAAPPSVRQVPGAWVQRATYKSDGTPLIGQRISIRGLRALQTDVLLRVHLLDGSTHTAILRPNTPTFEIPARESKKEVALATWKMGVIHILEGFDHLLFLLALMLIVTGFWPLVKTITAFTVAHSITLALATLGVVHFPPAPTEAVIALSIVFLAAEVVRKRQGQVVLTERYPWAVAFGFGLIHGLGFAGALSQIGIPQNEVPLALLMFNLGVETGQIAFVMVVGFALAGIRRIPITPPQGAWRLAPYAIGGLAAFWTIQRVVSMLPPFA
jgi:hydrogenase/urease accessory protein HupE